MHDMRLRCIHFAPIICTLFCPFSPVTASGAGSDAICNSSIVGEDGFDEGFPKVENFMHIIDLKSCDKVREP